MVSKEKELHFVCIKCGHHLFVDEKPGWVKKLTKDCPSCGEEWSQWDGLFCLIGYGNYKDFIRQK